MPAPHLLPLGPFDQCCPYEDRFGRTYIFHIPSLIESVRRHEGECRKVNFPLSVPLLLHGISHGSVMPEVLDSITGDDLLVPALICEFGPREHFMVDGRHRCCRSVQLGLRTMRAYIIPEAVWRHSLCTREELTVLAGLRPNHLTNSPRGLADLNRRLTKRMREHFAAQGKPYYNSRPITRPVKVWIVNPTGEVEWVDVPPDYEAGTAAG